MNDFEKKVAPAMALFILVGINAMIVGAGVFVVTWTWNTLFSDVVQLPTISFAQGVALAILLGFIRTAVSYFFNKDRQ